MRALTLPTGTHICSLGSTDNGTWRRLTVVPFQAVIPEKDSVQNYAEVLARDAGEAILTWAIDGAGNFIRNGCKSEADAGSLAQMAKIVKHKTHH